MESADSNLKAIEYQQAISLQKYHGTLIFGHITVFLGASGWIVKTLVERSSPGLALPMVLGIVGICLAVAFFLIGYRAKEYSEQSRDRAKALECELGLRLMQEVGSKKRFPRAFNVTFSIYVLAGFGWVAYLLWLLCQSSP
jgi:uncharacterized membrane protein YeaQ/YmgE (transglycosylase-associated protein family)